MRSDFSATERERYSRQMLLPEVGAEGQARLRAASVLLVGVGGLGAPAALYLAAAGVGRLVLVDSDRVDRSNLHRQVLYTEADLGRPKVEAAADRLRALNPEIAVEAHPKRFDERNGLALAGASDLVLDGADNFATRYLVSDACVLTGRPNVHGSVFRFEGQAAVFHHGGGPCYRCLFPAPPPEGAVPSCAAGGVLGVLPGLIGMIQATEAVKLLLGIGQPLGGRLLLYEALAMGFRELPIARDPDCPACGERPTIRELRREAACGGEPEPDHGATTMISPIHLQERLRTGEPPTLVDVREPSEYAEGHLPESRLIPLGRLAAEADQLDPNAEIVVYCRMGPRGDRAVSILRERGFTNVRNLRGGILAWEGELAQPPLPGAR